MGRRVLMVVTMRVCLLAAIIAGMAAGQVAPPAGPIVFGMDGASTTFSAVATDAAGNIYVAGYTSSGIFPTTAGVVQPEFAPGLCQGLLGLGLSPLCYEGLILKLDLKGNILFSTFLSGDGGSTPMAIVVDAQGSIYVAGYAGPNFPTTAGAAFSSPQPSGYGQFVTKLNTTGDKLIYSTYVPGLLTAALAVDGAGNAYIAGEADSDLPATPGAFQTKGPNTALLNAGAVVKLSGDGSKLLYATYLTGHAAVNANYSQSAPGIAVDAAGEAYVTGSTNGVDFPVTPGAYQTKLPAGGGVGSAYVSKLNAEGSGLIYSTYLGGSGIEFGNAVKVNSDGGAWILGETTSTNFPVTAGALQSSPATTPALGGESGFLTKMSADGSGLVYSSYLTGQPAALDEDAEENVYVAGYASYGFPVTSGAFQRCMNGGDADIYLAEFTPAGALAGATYLGGSRLDVSSAVAAMGRGTAVVAGSTSSPDFPGLEGVLPTSLAVVASLRIDDPARTESPCMSLTLENAASYAEGAIAPGEIVTIHGDGIGPAAGVSGAPGANAQLPVNLAGVKVFFDQLQAPLLFVQNGQVNAIAPWELNGSIVSAQSQTTVHVEYNGVATNSTTIPLVQIAPAIFFTTEAVSSGLQLPQAAVLNEDGSLNSSTNPAPRGSVVSMFGTGAGPTNPAGVTGGIWPLSPLANLAIPLQVSIGEVDSQVLYEGSAPELNSGMFQMNVVVPLGLKPGSPWITINPHSPLSNPPVIWVK